MALIKNEASIKVKRSQTWQRVSKDLFQVTKLAREGLSKTEIAKRLGISFDTFRRYEMVMPEFQQALARGMERLENIAEEKLNELVKAGNLQAITFVLTNLVPEVWNRSKVTAETNASKNDLEATHRELQSIQLALKERRAK